MVAQEWEQFRPWREMQNRASTASFNRAVPVAEVREKEQENMEVEKELSSKREGFSPLPGNLKEQAEAKRGSPSKFHDKNLDHAPDHVRCATRTISTTTTITPILKISSSSLLPATTQGLKKLSSTSSAAPGRGMSEGDCLRREPVSPSQPSMQEGDQQSPRNDRGWSAKLNKLVDEADGAAGILNCVPVDGDLSRSPAHQPARASDLGDRVKNPVDTHAASFHRADEDQPQGIQEEENSVGSAAASFNREAEDQPQGVRSEVHQTVSPRLFMEVCRPDESSDLASDSASQSLYTRGLRGKGVGSLEK